MQDPKHNVAGIRCQRFRELAIRLPAVVVLLLGPLLAIGCSEPTIVNKPPELIIGEHGLGPGQFHIPRGIAQADDGSLFIVDMTARIQRITPDGTFEKSWKMPAKQKGKPTGISVSPDGHIMVADTHYSRVMIFDRDGKELSQFGSYGRGDGEFIYPTAVAVSPIGTYYVSEYGGNDRINWFSSDFEYLGSFRGDEEGGLALNRPQSIKFDETGVLWVADACNHRICQFDTKGKLLGQFGTPGKAPGELSYPYDFDFCKDGTILVSEFGNNRIQRFNRQGQCLGTWGGPGNEPGQLLQAWGVVTDKLGRVFVVDARNHRIQMFRM